MNEAARQRPSRASTSVRHIIGEFTLVTRTNVHFVINLLGPGRACFTTSRGNTIHTSVPFVIKNLKQSKSTRMCIFFLYFRIIFPFSGLF